MSLLPQDAEVDEYCFFTPTPGYNRVMPTKEEMP